jgi:hypothetical protein
MRKIIFLLAIFQLLAFSCQKVGLDKNKSTENILLAKEVTITTPVLIDNQNNPQLTASFNKKPFFDTLFSRALRGEIQVYGSEGDFDDIQLHKIEPLDQIIRKTKPTTDEGIVKTQSEILFYEKWNFDVNHLKMIKEVLSWSPINNWQENGEDKRQWVFHVNPKAQIKGKKIAESIFYEEPLVSTPFLTTIVGFDYKAFLKFIKEAILSGEITAYDPIYLVDKSKRKFTIDELNKYINQDIKDPRSRINAISLLFEEDWYFDENTLCITKDVKSIGFVQESWDPKIKILFFIFPKE